MSNKSSFDRLKIEVSDKRIEMEHFHQYAELCYVLQGRMELEMGMEKVVLFEEGIYLINANKRHTIRLSEDGLIVKVCISFELLSEVLDSIDVRFLCNSNMGDNEHYDKLREKIKGLLSYYINTDSNTYEFGYLALCYELLDVLAVNFMVRDIDMRKNQDENKNTRIAQINNYVRGNYKSQLSLKDLADKLYLSEAYLSRFFKKTYGMTFLKYVTNIRASHAYDDLLNTEESITKIAYDNGFQTVANFNKTFKQIYGQTPSEIRKNQCKEDESCASDSNKKLKQRLEQYMKEGGFSEVTSEVGDEIFVNASIGDYDILQSSGCCYRNAINVGSADDMLKAEVREHIAILADELHFEYARFWNMFNENTFLDLAAGDGNFNFSKIDSIIDFLLEHNIKPAMELGIKPRRIQGSVNQPIVKEENQNIRYDCEMWDALMNALFEHLNDRYGVDVASEWVVELWLDERADTIPGYDYFKLFTSTAKIVKKYNKHMRIGGCGIRDDRGKEQITEFLTTWHQQEILPDYISMIHFPYVSGEIKNDLYSRRNTDNDSLYHAIEQLKASMKAAGFEDNTPIFISEWSNTISDRNAINDSCFKGAYVLKNLIQNIDTTAGIGYFLATDRIVEYSDTNEKLFGGTGLITKDSIFKPAAFAFDFMRRLKPKILSRGKNYLITIDENENLFIVCHNQKKLNYNYYFSGEADIDRESLWKYNEDNDNLEINFSIDNVNCLGYKARTYRVNEEHGSILDIWKSLDFDNNLSKDDIRFCRKICQPNLSISTIATEDKKLCFNLVMKANEIACISLKALNK